mgnify:CR=1 FL=1
MRPPTAGGARAPGSGDAPPWDAEAERAALRRVAAAVVDGSEPAAALTLAAREVAALADAEQGFVFRVDGDAVVVAGAAGVERAPVGARHTLLADGVVPRILRGRGPARVEGRPRPLGRENSATWWIAPVYRGAVGAPVFVGERLWGAVVAATTRPEALPAGAEARLAWISRPSPGSRSATRSPAWRTTAPFTRRSSARAPARPATAAGWPWC